MKELFRSASKIVFLMIAITVCVAFFVGKLESQHFMILASMAFTFYFANKGDNSKPYADK